MGPWAAEDLDMAPRPRTTPFPRRVGAGLSALIALGAVVGVVDAGGPTHGSTAAAAVVQPLGGGGAPAARTVAAPAAPHKSAIDTTLEAKLQERLSHATA